MNRVHVLNALPGAIIPPQGGHLEIVSLTWDLWAAKLRRHPGWVSAVGHADTAKLISLFSGVEVEFNRVSVPVLEVGDEHLLALYQGPRLPEGATHLPEGATLSPYLLTFY